jgi:hypothetical protein
MAGQRTFNGRRAQVDRASKATAACRDIYPIGSSGCAGQKREPLNLLDELARSYGYEWWFTAHHGMAPSENEQRDAAPADRYRARSRHGLLECDCVTASRGGAVIMTHWGETTRKPDLFW